jgi:hypothetical protein
LTLQYIFSSKAAVHTAIEKLWLNLNRDPSHRISRLFEIWVHWAHPLPSFLRWINKKFHTKQFFCSLEDIICFLFWIQHVYLACHYSNAQFFLSLAINNYFLWLISAYFSIKLLLCLTIAHSFSMWGLKLHIRSLWAPSHMKNFIYTHSSHSGTFHFWGHMYSNKSAGSLGFLAYFCIEREFFTCTAPFWEEIKQKLIFFYPIQLTSWDALTTTFSYLLDNIDAHDVWQNWSTL